MIEIIIDHSYEDSYFMISEVNVNIKSESEKMRIEKLLKERNLIGSLIHPDQQLKTRISKLLEVDESEIDFDTNEIDLM